MAKSTKKSVKKSVKRTVKSSKRASTNPSRKPTKSSPKPIKPAPAKKASKAPKFRSPVPRSPSNPFRESSYGICFDLLASKPEGMPRAELIAQLAKITGKPVKNAGYDAAVVLSARPDGRHQSCRPGFIVIRENDNVRLEVTTSNAGK